MVETHDVIIIGAGQAGLALSHEFSRAGRAHLVLDRGLVGQSWRDRWDSFCLVLPNWTVKLPGGEYSGADPDGFMARDEFVEYLGAYARSFDAPVQGGVEVQRLRRASDGGFGLVTPEGELRAREVVVATGGFQKPYLPAAISELGGGTQVIDAGAYMSPSSLEPGAVLVVGSGQTGCQIAEELCEAGRDVVLACGRAPWQPRRIGDRDTTGWFVGTPFMNMRLEDLPSPMARLGANPQASGRDGGHDLHFRTLQAMGVRLAGHVLGSDHRRAFFADDLADSVAFGHARYNDLRNLVAKKAVDEGLPIPEMPDPEPFSVAGAPASVDLSKFGAVVVTSGFRPEYRAWMDFPDAFDEMGFPIQVDGSSTVVRGLHFMGVHFMRKRTSATLMGVGEDAVVLAEKMVVKGELA